MLDNDLAESFTRRNMHRFHRRRLSSERSQPSSERSHRSTMLTRVDHTGARFTRVSSFKSPVVQALGQPTVTSPYRRNSVRRPRVMDSFRALVDSGFNGHTISPEAAALLLSPRIARGPQVSPEAVHSQLVCILTPRRAFLIFIPSETHLCFHL